MPTFNFGTAGGFSLGAIIAIIVLALCVVLAVLGKPLSPALVLGLVASLAVARLT